MSSAPFRSDEEFQGALAEARAGAEWAWRELYRDAAPRVLRFLRARNSPEPEDVLGDVFLKAVRNLHTFEGGVGDFHAWLLTIARNRVIDLSRRAVRKPVLVDAEELQEVPAPGSDPALASERRMTGLKVRSVIDGLSPDQRDVMLLRVVSDLTLEETARVLGKTIGAVKALQVRAVAHIRHQMAGEAVSL